MDGPHSTVAVSDLVDVGLRLGMIDSINSRLPSVGSLALAPATFVCHEDSVTDIER